jgi:alanine racemase
MKLFRFLRAVKKSFSSHTPSIEVSISKGNLLHNLGEYRKKYPNFLFAPVLKSNAYGHGLVETAKILNKENIPFFVVDSLYEAMILRDSGVKSKILIIGHTRTENIKNAKLPEVSFCVSSLEQLEGIAKILKSKIRIHLKLDTGMRRQGILPEEIGKAAEVIKKSDFLELEGICSHFADAENSDGSFTESQILKWNSAVSFFEEEFRNIRYLHVSATAGTRYLKKACGNAVRLGIGLYGISGEKERLDLKPVLEMRSIISSIKTIKKGDCVGYGCLYKAKKEMKIATVPAGYFEGIDRRLSNQGVFKINGKDCPIVGAISMNITSMDITSAPDAKSGSEVIIIGGNKKDKNSIENIAKLVKTIPYEILVRIPQHLRRTVIV